MKTATAILVLATTAFLAGCGGAIGGSSGNAPKVGDTVIFKTSAIVYSEGKVEKIEGGKYEIRTGSNIAKTDAADVYALPKAGSRSDVKAGDLAIAFSRESYWAGGEVKNVTSEIIEIEPVSGAKINAAHDKVIRVSPAAVADIRQSLEKKGFEEVGKSKKPVLPKEWKPKKGEKVAAQWSFGTWHVAIIKNVNPNNVDLDWQNGWSDGSVGLDKIAPYPSASTIPPAVGAYVIVKPPTDTQEWKFATVSTVSGDEIEVKFADSKTQRIKMTDVIVLT